jgi:polysaccharide export outer membrane protein
VPFAVLCRAQSPIAQSPVGSSTQPSLETPQQTNDRIRSLSSSVRTAPHDYIIGAGDLVSVQVFDVPELSRELRVSQTGTVGIPLIPVRLHISGLTETQAELKIQEVLEANGLVTHPEVSVTVRERKSRPITVVGAVGHPMVFSSERQSTLIEVLAEAGGIANDAGDTVIVTRQEADQSGSSEPPQIGPQDVSAAPAQAPLPPANAPAASATHSEKPETESPPQKPLFPSPPAVGPSPPAGDPANPPEALPPPLSNKITVNLNQLLESGDLRNNIVLQPGDIVTVPHAGIIYVLGAVSRPGGFVVSNDRAQLTTLKVLSLAGGLNRTAKSDRAVIVRKDNTGQQREVAVDLKRVMNRTSEDLQLQPSDILYVPNSNAKAALIRAGEIGLGIATGVAIYRLYR